MGHIQAWRRSAGPAFGQRQCDERRDDARYAAESRHGGFVQPPRVSNNNSHAEALFCTCKYRPDYPRKAFGSVEATRAWTQQFVRWYNHEHKHSGLKFVTPAQRHRGVATAVLALRDAVYAQAKARNPQRWFRSTRNWQLKDEVWLNPERTPRAELKQCLRSDRTTTLTNTEMPQCLASKKRRKVAPPLPLSHLAQPGLYRQPPTADPESLPRGPRIKRAPERSGSRDTAEHL